MNVISSALGEYASRIFALNVCRAARFARSESGNFEANGRFRRPWAGWNRLASRSKSFAVSRPLDGRFAPLLPVRRDIPRPDRSSLPLWLAIGPRRADQSQVE